MSKEIRREMANLCRTAKVYSGPAFSRLDRLLPIGPRAKGGPVLRLQTYTFNRKCFL